MPSSANRPENGGISFRVPEEAQGWRLDKALGLLLASPSPEQEAARPGLFALADLGLRARRRLCDRSLVLVNGKPGIPGLKLRAGQEIIILPDPEGAAIPEDAPSLVYKDGGIAALYKPAGMHTAALAGSLSPSLETLLGELLLQNGNTVEVILESALVTAGNHQNVVQTGTDCFLHHVLNRGAIDDGEHFLRGCLRCGQESGAQTSSRNNCLSNRLNFSSHATRIP